MRIRSTKPEFWRSKRISSVSWDARLVLKGLESYVDDNGVGKDDLALIVSDVFPRDMAQEPSGTFRRVQAALHELHEAGLVWRYEHDGTDLLYIAFWEQAQYVQRPAKGRLRRPDGTWQYGDSEIREPVRKAPEGSGHSPEASIPKQGIRGSGEQVKDSCASARAERDKDRYAEFDDWYQHYPRKRGKGQAMKAYRAARKKVSHETLVQAIKDQAPKLTEKGVEFCPYPATWLNGERWEDQPDAVAQRAARSVGVDQWLA